MELTKSQILNSEVFTFKQKIFVRKSEKETFIIDSLLNIEGMDYKRSIQCENYNNYDNYIELYRM